MDDEKTSCCRFEHQTYGGIHYCEKLGLLLTASGDEIPLRRKSLEVFCYLSERAGKVVSRDELISEVWGQTVATDDSLAQCISDIRRAIGDSKREILRTEHRRGYRLIKSKEKTNKEHLSNAGNVSKLLYQSDGSWYRKSAFAALVIAVFGTFWLYGFIDPTPAQQKQRDGIPSVSVIGDDETFEGQYIVDETRAALSLYRTIRLVDYEATYQLSLTSESGTGKADLMRFHAELIDLSGSGELRFAESWNIERFQDKAIEELAARIAAAIASPGGGAIGNDLLARSRHKEVVNLTRAECYAHGYGCKTCSGEEESITPRARECLDNLLRENPEDARAWALKSAVLTRMKWFGIMVSETQRADAKFMQSLEEEAIEAANRAEAYSDGTDSSIYWGMAQSFITACHADKLQAAVEKGLQINPNDPSLLASFGNWLAYSGFWEQGVSMVNRALELEPRRYKKFWLFAPAKHHYNLGDFQSAYDGFMRAYNDRNWLSHLQLAYTLPYLGRIEEARTEVARVAELFPSMSRMAARQFYRNFCFKDDYIEKMDTALAMTGMKE